MIPCRSTRIVICTGFLAVSAARNDTRAEDLCLAGQVLRLPPHGGQDAVPAAGVIEEDPLLDRAGTHLAVLAEVNGRLRETVRLPAGVDAIHVRFGFLRPGHGVDDR